MLVNKAILLLYQVLTKMFTCMVTWYRLIHDCLIIMFICEITSLPNKVITLAN